MLTTPREVHIRDMRPRESNFTFDRCGFVALKNVSAPLVDFDDDSQIETDFHPEIQSLILPSAKDAKSVLIYDYTTRSAKPSRTPCRPFRKARIDPPSTAPSSGP
jgi:hypothetical protein